MIDKNKWLYNKGIKKTRSKERDDLPWKIQIKTR